MVPLLRIPTGQETVHGEYGAPARERETKGTMFVVANAQTAGELLHPDEDEGSPARPTERSRGLVHND